MFSPHKSNDNAGPPRPLPWVRAAMAHRGHARRRSVDETAVTLKLPAVPWRHRLLAHVPADLGPLVAAAAVVAGLWLATGQPEAEPTQPSQPAAPPKPIVAEVEPTSFDTEPVLASAAPRGRRIGLPGPSGDDEIIIFDDVADDEIVIYDDSVDDHEIIIFDEPVQPPRRMTRAAQRRARRAARRHTRQGEAARRKNDSRAAKRHFRAALDALPSYAPAAAALAELHMKDREYRAALGYAKRASRSDRRKADYMLLLGDAYFLTKQREAAKKVWRKAADAGSAKAKSRLSG